ncbi:tRNA (adenosine(37)-N6)-threonylcarbamoyltransferase complex ATPase subunit type 1 TsaE [Jeotgalibacillus sp. R-1-5s-1]|uniref:tRNA (adenosine(37)-N6)-threonylcarbamoyltransferase complex ATPase subunit type 1 TsaE n=1 Tax=Jeotgalibacillus sp. R-1-5s-1 TaxID=2555897 RepID=UPI00106AB846|nr:tRNA (adenosine(37)-N6)-threonylcarbamoyltransferase complex ATPase subunit type 1 TsaE [Jeotgalibacillus sp. R-1-5s-1]TFD93690.1 tRNA (adenosine(37)-N6)-threonylcarbamoyltransferase complex ATPase subunit type 1 TsaE [Jeotgalibacillus sp. R-1-5s-1]
MNKHEWHSSSPEETAAFAEKLGSLLQKGDVLTLEGDLGAGKTTFTKGLAKGLEITRTVNSPTFTIMKEYQGRLPLYHMDVYRVEDEFEDLGFDEYFNGDGVCVVEWAHLIQEQLPEERLDLSIYYVENDSRRFELVPRGSRYEALCEEILR